MSEIPILFLNPRTIALGFIHFEKAGRALKRAEALKILQSHLIKHSMCRDVKDH
ncbi:MAG: hypothetical protein ACJAXX_000581 [Roseivirga sp.]|jgi:hypothetical protein